MIPVDAVEAAAKVIYSDGWDGAPYWESMADDNSDKVHHRAIAQHALEAAAPYMLQVSAWLINEHRVSWDEQGLGSCRRCGPLIGALEAWKHQARILAGAVA